MSGTAYTRLKQGDPCWIVVDRVNHPTGRWRGTVLVVEERRASGSDTPWYQVTAKIVDHPTWHDPPNLHYDVYPVTADFTQLLDLIDSLREASKVAQTRAEARESALLDAMVALKRAGFSDPR